MRKSHVRPLLTACLLTLGLVVLPVGATVALASPHADFDWTPKPVVAGAPLTLVSTSTPSSSGDDDDDDDAMPMLLETRWELGAWGSCEGTALTATCTTTAPAPGRWDVTLTVSDLFLETDSETKTIAVEDAARPATPSPTPAEPVPRPSLLNPFPIVTVAGEVTRAGTRIDRLAVRAPRGSRVLVRCRGADCPLKRVSKSLRKTRTRVRAAERLMPPGVGVEVLVRRGDSIGKFTRLRFREERPPRRADGCLWPGTNRMAACPGG
jgi:hypothetical protein